MVGDLVVGEKRVVGRVNAAKHVRGEHELAGFLHHGGGCRAHEGVLNGAMNPRLDVAADLPKRLPAFANDIGEIEAKGPREEIRIEEIRDVGGRAGTTAVVE